MAEGWANNLKGQSFNFFSAGTTKHGLNPYAIKVMKEVGIDISTHKSNTIDEIKSNIDIVFTVCSDAHENCPYTDHQKIIHVGFDDPPRLTQNETNEHDRLEVYRRVRDEIKVFIENLESYIN